LMNIWYFLATHIQFQK